MPGGANPNPMKPLLLLPLAALLATLPLILHGSCGQDLLFHTQSWLDAATQLRHAHYPHWDITAAWNAGEPRFLFYPPLSWLLGAILTMIFPIAACPTIFIFIALLASGLTFYKLASHFVSPNPALIASALYLANPYMLFNAFERSALAELLAAAWIPLLLLAILRTHPISETPAALPAEVVTPQSPAALPAGFVTPQSPAGLPARVVTIRGIAIPLALLWLTNAPAAVIGSYALALLATFRVLSALLTKSRLSSRPEAEGRSGETCSPLAPPHPYPPQPNPSQPSAPPQPCPPERSDSRTMRIAESKDPPHPQPGTSARTLQPLYPTPLRLTLTYLAGAALGLALPAFYLIPAACERRFIQVSMAILPNLRPQDNFLFIHTADAAHNAVNHTASLLALTLLILTAASLLALFLRRRPLPTPKLSTTAPATSSPQSVISIEAQSAQDSDPPLLTSRKPVISTEAQSAQRRDPQLPPYLAPILTLSTAIIAFLITPISLPIWRHLPELAFLQFPWRLLILLAPILALAVALLLDRILPAPPSLLSSLPDSRNLMRSAVESGATGERPLLDGVRRLLYFAAATLILPLILGLYTFHLYHQPCDPTGNPSALAQALSTHHGTLPTDEYTPTNADNDLLRSDNPGFWLIPQAPTRTGIQTETQAGTQPQSQPANPNTPAPHTLPTATELNPSIDTDDTPIPLAQTLSTPAPHHLTLNLTHPAILVLNLRDYPSWRITNLRTPELPPHLQRADGLLAIPLLDGPATIDITWRRTPDQSIGLTVSALALLALALTFRRKTLPQPKALSS